MRKQAPPFPLASESEAEEALLRVQECSGQPGREAGPRAASPEASAPLPLPRPFLPLFSPGTLAGKLAPLCPHVLPRTPSCEGPRAQLSPRCSGPDPIPHLPALSEGWGNWKGEIGVAAPDVCTSVLHQQETGEGEMFECLPRGWGWGAWPDMGHLAGTVSPPWPGGSSHLQDSALTTGKQPCCQQGGAPPFLLWLTLLHMYGVGGAAEWGGTQDPQEDRP